MSIDCPKLVQIAAAFLRESPGHRMSYLRLLKLMYLLDRESVAETGLTASGDRSFAMKHGPVLSETFDIIKSESIHSPEWESYIEKSGYSVLLLRDPGNDRLSRFQLRAIQGLTDRFRSDDDWSLVEHTHTLPEWQRNDPGNSSREIPFEHVLEAVGRGSESEAIRAEVETEDAIRRFLESKRQA
ncbi:MAG: SocA family protein [Phycisphaerales bacterium]|jgi:uncharacterized phage-associated protein|nr:SocA family protein [Phycisphaerales bacterium]